jgi:peptidoglycan hydrolase-like protein with peptidoglycan-binding domain
VVKQVQGILRDLNFYAGAVDGLQGPNTHKAIETYQRKVGLAPSGEIDNLLLDQLGATPTTAAVVPQPAPRADVTNAIPANAPAATGGADARIVKIQAGLKAFGNDGIQLDGVVGARTVAAIREFQSLLGQPVTGEPDEVVYAKMREIGLTN